MSNSLADSLIVKLTDWLLALCGVGLLIWFAVTQPIFLSKSESKPLSVDLAKLQGHVKSLTKGELSNSSVNKNINSTAAYIYKELEGLGNLEYQNIQTLAGQHQNVVLQLGMDSREVFVIGAAYTELSTLLDAGGNASGIATLIELARQLSKSADRLTVNVILVAYPLFENQSNRIASMGSYYHAGSLKKSGKDVRLMISLDNIGQLSNGSESQKTPNQFMQLINPDRGNPIKLMGRLQDIKEVRQLKKSFRGSTTLPLFSRNLPESFSKTQSFDHKNYWLQDFPAVLISDSKKYRNTEPSQQISERFDYVKMAMLVQGLHQVVMDAVSNSHITQIAQEKNKSGPDLILY